MNKLKVNTFQDNEVNMFYRTSAGGGTERERERKKAYVEGINLSRPLEYSRGDKF